jgi:hypothetical protein
VQKLLAVGHHKIDYGKNHNPKSNTNQTHHDQRFTINYVGLNRNRSQQLFSRLFESIVRINRIDELAGFGR